MNIVVTIKQVPDPNIPPSHLELEPDGKRIASPFGIAPVMNGYDANALEEALRLKEKHGGRVTALGLGDDSSREALKAAIAMGADAAVLLNDPEWLDCDAGSTGHVLAAAIRKTGAIDLVLCGRQASDTDGGQVLHWIAQSLDLPAVTPVASIEVQDGSALVSRLAEDGHERLRVRLPAVLGVSSEANEPRFPPVRGTMAAARAHIPAWKRPDLKVETGENRVELRKLTIPTAQSKAAIIRGASPSEQGAALADKLHELGLIA